MFKTWLGGIILLCLLTAGSTPARGNVPLAFDSTSLEFGNVGISSSPELVLEVWDTAATPIEIDQISIAGLNPADFSIISPGTPLVLGPGTGKSQIIVQFTPQAFGPRSGLLVIVTTSGTVTLPLAGFGTIGAQLSWAKTTIDFGTITPGQERDTVVELYSTGSDTAQIEYIQIGASDTSFVAELASGSFAPFSLAPRDSVPVKISFRGLTRPGIRVAQLTAFGSSLNSPICDLLGDVEFGSFEILPGPTIDFGVLYAGQIVDSMIQIVNTSDVTLGFEGLDLAPAGNDFILLNAPQVPFSLAAGDTLSLVIQANSGIHSPHHASLQVFSPQAGDSAYMEDTISDAVIQPPIQFPFNQGLAYFCANVLPIADTISISNSGPQTVVITGLGEINSSDTILANRSFPDTLAAGISQSVIVQLNPLTATADTLLLALLGGVQTMVTDTVALQPMPIQASATLIPTTGVGTEQQQIAVATASTLKTIRIDSIILHLSVLNPNLVTIDPATIALAQGLSNAFIASVDSEAGGYAVTISSDSPISVALNTPLLVMLLDRYVSNNDSTSIVVSIETPELGGCLIWTADTLSVNGAEMCGSSALRNILSLSPSNIFAMIRENPVLGSSADLTLTAGEPSTVHYEVANVLGKIQLQGFLNLVAGTNDFQLSTLGLPAGVYNVRLILQNGMAESLRFVKIV